MSDVIYSYPVQYPRHEQALAQAASSAKSTTSSAAFLTAHASGTEAGLFGADGLSFKDVLDVINPLQQLPIVGSLYRSTTGDTISAASRMAGGLLLGGPIGFALAALSSGFEAMTGSDPVQTMVAMVTGDGGGGTQVAAAASKYEKAYWLS